MRVDVLPSLTPAQTDDLHALLARAARRDGHPALPEPLATTVARLSGAPDPGSPRILLAYDGTDLVGCGFVTPPAPTDHVPAIHLVIDPDRRDAAEDETIRNALVDGATSATAPAGTMRLWALGATETDDRVAARHGFRHERDLLQMRVPLPLPEDVRAAARSVATRPFRPGSDDEAWLEINNRAFAGHPEQGGWTLDQLHDRLASEWVDLDGFLMADAAANGAPDSPGLIGSCWTKVHRANDPVLGEIYVISVNPDHHSQGWGKALTVAGLAWLTDQGIAHGMLYTDAANTAAVTLYRALGFADHHIDRAYLRPAAG